ncbi:MAG TPA: 5-formyltetrahydrofolate cyclo-ligase, partial [Pseudolabrys sp.]
IGYGAGYYDMTIHRLRGMKKVIAIGIAFAAQEIAKVPATERDERLDLVLTEREVIDFRGT